MNDWKKKRQNFQKEFDVIFSELKTYSLKIEGTNLNIKNMEKLYTQPETALILGFKNYRSLNVLISSGELECVKRRGKNGRKLFTERQIQRYIDSKKI